MKLLDVGDAAPDFEAPDQTGSTVRLRDLRGRWVVLYFYPKDRTFGCTKEACGFRDDHEALRLEGAEVVGVSRDDTESHADFAVSHRLNFRIVADPTTQILDAYGARAWYGRAHRVTYLIDPHGTVAKVYRHVNPLRHAEQVLHDLRALKQESNRSVRIETTPTS